MYQENILFQKKIFDVICIYMIFLLASSDHLLFTFTY